MGADLPPLFTDVRITQGPTSNLKGSQFVRPEIQNADGTMRDIDFQITADKLTSLTEVLSTFAD